MEKKEARKKVLILMACSLALRILTATSIELGNDEAYYALYPRFPAWSYFDHPGMLAWAVRILNVGLPVHSALAMRLPALVFGTANIYIAFLLGSRLKNALCGYYAALLFVASIYVTVICGVFILPDTPQSFFWLLALYCLSAQFRTSNGRYWLPFGLFAGLAILSKYHGVFLWAGAGLYVLTTARKQLTNPYLYVGALITAVCLFPIIYWNSQHDWASFAYQGNRPLGTVQAVHWDNLLQQILGEWFYNSLWVVGLILAALFAYRRNRFLEPMKMRFLLCMSLPLILFVWSLSTRRETLPHWTGPAYFSLMLLPAAWLTQRRTAPRILWACVGLTGALIIAGMVVVNMGLPGHESPSALNKDFHKDDFTLDLYGWAKTRKAADSLLTVLVRKGDLSPDYQFLQVNWFNGAHVDFYVAGPLGKETLVLGSLRDIHQFYWINRQRDWSGVTDYCFLTNSREYQGTDRLPPFIRQDSVRTDTLAIYRGGRVAEAVFLTIFRNVSPDSVKDFICFPTMK